MKRVTSVLILVGALVGCASAPAPRFYTLDMKPSGRAALNINVDIDRVRPSEALARPNILIETSSTTVDYYQSDQWVQELGALVAEKLAAEFGPRQNDRTTLVLYADLQACGQVDTPTGVEAHLKAEVSLRNEDIRRYDTPVLERTYEARKPAATPDASGVVAALSACVEEIAVLVAADIGKL